MPALVQATHKTKDGSLQPKHISGAKAIPSQEPATDAPLNEMISYLQELHTRSMRLRNELDEMLRTIQPRSVNDYASSRDCDRAARQVAVPNFETLAALDTVRDSLGYSRSALDWRMSLSNDFVYKVEKEELDALHALETQLRQLQSQSELLIEKILDQVPMTAQQALAKLKLMAGIMLDSECLEIDYFACLVAECAKTLESNPALSVNTG